MTGPPSDRSELLAARAVFDNVLVVPYQQLLSRPQGGHDHQGGPVWPEWDEQVHARFNRDGKPVDLRPTATAASNRLSGHDYVWVGPVHPHFGHGMAEFLTRLPCSIHGTRQPKLVFSSRASRPVTSLDAAPAWFRGILDWYSVNPSDVVLVAEPTEFEHLAVFPQPEQLPAVGPSAAYLDLLDEISATRLDSAGAGRQRCPTPAYISRAGTQSGFAGESYLETVLAQLGFEVFRPEQHSIVEQMRFYHSRDKLVFAEGSALHGTQLLGRSLGQVTVLNRRTSSDHFCEAFLRPRADALNYVDCVRGMVHGDNKLGKPALAAGISLLDQDKLADWARRFGLDLASAWHGEAFAESEIESIRAWLKFINRRPKLRTQASSIYRSLQANGFESLVAEARDLFASESAETRHER